MVLLPDFGSLIEEIKTDGYQVCDEIYMALDGYNHYTMAKSLGVFMISFVDTLKRLKPDWMVLAGDRGEQLMAAIASAHVYTPIAHIQAGERSGNIDGVSRHAIGKFVHLHFAANEDAAKRLHRMGEQPNRIHNVGAPQLDELAEGQFSSSAELIERYGIDTGAPFLLVVQHPVTEEMDRADAQVQSLVQALRRFDMPKVWILPNNDAGSQLIRRGLRQSRTSDTHLFNNLPRADYLGFMTAARCIVGNSSSGLLEAPTFKLPAVNLGRRQADRVQGANVINAPFETDLIEQAIQKAISKDFCASQKNCSNPYGDGRSSERIIDILQRTPIDEQLLIKTVIY